MAVLYAVFWYLVGGITFLPISILIGYFGFLYLVPKITQSKSSGSESESLLQDPSFPLDSQLKASALDLAVRNDSNHKAHLQHQSSNQPKAPSTQVPSAAKRLGPSPPNLPPLPHKSGTLVVRRHFHQDSASSAGSSTGSSSPAAGGDGEGDGSQYSARGGVAPGDGHQKSGYMSGLYRGLMDYRSNRKNAATPTPANSSYSTPKQSMADVAAAAASASAANPRDASSSSASSSNSSSSTASPSGAAPNKPPSGTGSITTFHCILKPPILYLYSSSDVSSPMTECHAAIDLRGKRVSLFVNGVGDTMGEPGEDEEDEEDDVDYSQIGSLGASNARSRNVINQYDTTSSTNVSDVDADNQSSTFNTNPPRSMKRAQRNWNKARRATIRDGELFQKRNAIRIVAMGIGEAQGNRSNKGRDGNRNRSKSPASTKPNSVNRAPTNRAQWFIFCKSASQLEDWYHALLHASLLPSSLASSATSSSASFDADSSPMGNLFNPDHMVQLLASLDSIPDPIPLRWFNAILARIFFSVYKTSALEKYIIRKIMKKLSRVKTPGFLGDIVVREVDVGDRPPMFSRPMLKSATGDGEASMEVSIHYAGSLRITISATLTISLSSRLGLKPYTVPLVLAVVVRSLNGNLLLHVKPPPSNRLWFGFTKLPDLEIEVQPVVSERKIQWGMVTRLIEGRIRELLSESIVLPNMDDIPFFDTRQFDHRGGIWSDAGKGAGGASSQDPEAAVQPIPPVSNASKVKSSMPVSAPDSEVLSSKSSALEVPGAGSATDASTRRRENSNSSKVPISPAASARPSTSTSTSAESLAVGASNVLKARGPSTPLDNSAIGGGASKLSSSPSSAAAGLSSLLARDFAAQSQVEAANSSAASLPAQLEGAGSTSTSAGDRPQPQPPSKRRSWFVGPRFGNPGGSTASSPSPEYGPSSSTANAPASMSRRGGPQSSLAWGNASLSLPSGGRTASSTSTQFSSSSDPAVSTAAELDSNLDTDSTSVASLSTATSLKPTHQKDKDSVSSWSTEESDEGRAVTSTATGTDSTGNENIKGSEIDSFRAGIEQAFETDQSKIAIATNDDQLEPPTPRRPSHIVKIQAPLEGQEEAPIDEASLLRPEASSSDPPLTPTASNSNHSSRRSSTHSLIPRPKEMASTHRTQDAKGRDSELSSRDRSQENLPSLASRKSTASTASSVDSGGSRNGDVSSTKAADNAPSGKVFGATHGFPQFLEPESTNPKSQQGSSSKGREASTPGLSSGPASAMSAAQQSRYGLGPAAASPPSTSSSGTSSALLLSSWNKAKASLADKESRQAAAKEARDALKKGWKTWKGGAQESNQPAQIPSSNFPSYGSGINQKGSEEPFGQTPPRSRTSSWLGQGAAETTDPASLGLGFDVDRVDTNSRSSSSASSNDGIDSKDKSRDDETRSSGSERAQYKDYRLQKSKGASQRQGNLSQSQILASTAQWSESVPSLSAPAPAARRKDPSTIAGSPKESNSVSSTQRSSGDKIGSDPNSHKTSASAANLGYTAPQAPQAFRKASVTSISSDKDIRRDASATSPQGNPISPRLEQEEVRKGSGPGSTSPQISSRNPSASSISSSSSKPVGIKTQPGRAQMMSVPGIHSSRGPQSFSSPTPEPTPLPSSQLSSNQDGQKGLGLSMFREMFNKQQNPSHELDATSPSLPEPKQSSDSAAAAGSAESSPGSASSINRADTLSKSGESPAAPHQHEVHTNEEVDRTHQDVPVTTLDESEMDPISDESKLDPISDLAQTSSVSEEIAQEAHEIVKTSLQNEPATSAAEAESKRIALGNGTSD